MSEWLPICDAPTNGDVVITGIHLESGQVFNAIRSRFLCGKWTAEFDGGQWRTYDPQPTHWLPTAGHSRD